MLRRNSARADKPYPELAWARFHSRHEVNYIIHMILYRGSTAVPLKRLVYPAVRKETAPGEVSGSLLWIKDSQVPSRDLGTRCVVRLARFLFKCEQNCGCPIHFAFFAKWVG